MPGLTPSRATGRDPLGEAWVRAKESGKNRLNLDLQPVD